MKTEPRYNNAPSAMLLKFVRCRKVSRGDKGVEGKRPYANFMRRHLTMLLCPRGSVEGGGDHHTAHNGGRVRHNKDRESFGCRDALSGYYPTQTQPHQGEN